MNNKYRAIRKWLVYGLIYTIMAVLQATVAPYVTLFGVHPNLLPMAATIVAVLEGGVPGAMFGLFAGIVCDALYPTFEVIHTIFFFLSGFAIGQLRTALFKVNFVVSAFCSVLSLAVLDILLAFVFFFIPGKAGISVLYQVILPEVAFSALVTPLVYGPLRLVHRLIGAGAEEEILR